MNLNKTLERIELDPNAKNMDGALMIAKKAIREDYTQICDSPTPPPTRTHMPVPHSVAITLLADRIEHKGWDIVGATYASSYGRSNAHWVFQIKSIFADGVVMEIAGHNSNSKMSSYIIYMGDHVQACTNRSVPQAIPLRRKHTTNILNELEGLIDNALIEVEDARREHSNRIETYQETTCGNMEAHDLMIKAVETEVVPATYLPTIINEWREPSRDIFVPRTTWSLYNCFTESFKRSPASIPQRSERLKTLMDDFTCFDIASPLMEQFDAIDLEDEDFLF